jgi:transcriptional regulator with XRE-family HTH domain
MSDAKKRSFRHIAALVKNYRKNNSQRLGQEELSQLLGYKNGQFISNVEREKCSVPLKTLSKLEKVLEIPQNELIEAVVNDYRETVFNHMSSYQD